MEIYITCLLQILSFSGRFRKFEMKNFLRLTTMVADNISWLVVSLEFFSFLQVWLFTKDTTTQRWTVTKEINGKVKQSNKSNFPWKLKIYDKIKTGEYETANEFNKYFADICSSLAKNIPDPSMRFESFSKRANTTKLLKILLNKQKSCDWWNKL